jgi:type IV secretion system protein VirB9
VPEPAAAPPRPAGPNELVYPYEPGRDYYVEVQPGWPLTLVLEPGEQWTRVQQGRVLYQLEENEPQPWEVTHTAETAPLQHVFVTATKAGLQTGLIITTTKRAYAITCKSVKQTGIRFVRWTYPAVPRPPKQAPPVPAILPQGLFHAGYSIESSQPAPHWLPQGVWDNVQHLYIQFPVTTLADAVPMVRGIGRTGPYVLNSWQYKNVLILDQVPERVELRLGAGETAETATITRGLLHQIACPGHPECPQWPPQGRRQAHGQ